METIEKIESIKLERVPVVCRDRCIARKEQAKLARQLFKRLGIDGLSVTTPRYSIARVVDVAVPREPHLDGDYMLDGVNYENYSYGDMPETVPARAKHMRHHNACLKLGAILLKAFPCHDDRSDSQSDYFDSCWSIN